MEIICTDKAPSAIGPYSQAVRACRFLYCSGQIGIDPATQKLAGDDVITQTRQVFENIRAVLRASHLDLEDVVKATVFLQRMDDFPSVNEIYGKAFQNHKPARSTVEVARLPLGALIEVECVAVYED